jgi:hypothetical protein
MHIMMQNSLTIVPGQSVKATLSAAADKPHAVMLQPLLLLFVPLEKVRMYGHSNISALSQGLLQQLHGRADAGRYIKRLCTEHAAAVSAIIQRTHDERTRAAVAGL